MNCAKRFARILHRSRSTFSGSFNRKHNYVVLVCSHTTCRLTHFCMHKTQSNCHIPILMFQRIERKNRFAYYRQSEKQTKQSLIEIEAVDRKHIFHLFRNFRRPANAVDAKTFHYISVKNIIIEIENAVSQHHQYACAHRPTHRRRRAVATLTHCTTNWNTKTKTKKIENIFLCRLFWVCFLTQSLEKWSIDSIWHVAKCIYFLCLTHFYRVESRPCTAHDRRRKKLLLLFRDRNVYTMHVFCSSLALFEFICRIGVTARRRE